jgi:FAD synthetase
MKERVVATGVFDILHVGHLRFLKEAGKLGDELFVVVSSDKVAEREKRPPLNSQEDRRELVEALSPVDRAVIGYEGDKYRILVELKPDILVLGYDQQYDPKQIEEELKARGCNTRVVRLNCYADQSTSQTIQKINDRLNSSK